MKKGTITLTLITLIFSCHNLFAVEDQIESMYVHFTTADGSDSIVIHKISDIDSIVYYAPVIAESTKGTFVDSRDGNTYNWVTIGKQIWMAENLKATQYADGTAIPHVTDNTAWSKLETNDTDKAYCFYNNAASAGYGALYTYAAATNGDNSGNNVQGICPTGWHLPSDAEWTTLEDALTGDNKGSQLADSADLWNNGDLEDAEEFGASGFTALPGGYRRSYNGVFLDASDYGYWWSSTQSFSSNAYYRDLRYYFSAVPRDDHGKSSGFSVRCLKDSPEPQAIDWVNVTEGVAQADAMTDADGKSYSAVKIGTQIWMAENLNVNIATVDTTGGSADNICQTNDVFVWDNTQASYGKLYSWQAAQKACPTGWHLPSDAEWTSLTDYLATNHSGKESTALKSTNGWNDNGDKSGNGTDNYDFTALPGGRFNYDGNESQSLQGSYGFWWDSTPYGDNHADLTRLSYNLSIITWDIYANRNCGVSIRCVRD